MCKYLIIYNICYIFREQKIVLGDLIVQINEINNSPQFNKRII